MNTLDKIHKIQLNMALEVKRICQKNKINYFLVGGTLLGAVRHQGFIPWDDDLDIGMLRKDYNKFITCAKDELDKDYFLQTWESDKNYVLSFLKIRKNNTLFIERNSMHTECHKGIFIDIFPFDNVPNKKLSGLFQDKISYLLKRMLFAKAGFIVWEGDEKFKQVVYRIIKYVSIPFNQRKLIKLLDIIMNMYNELDTELVTNMGGAYGYKKESVKRLWLEDLKEIKFENEYFSGPKYSHEYLSHIYGDYMKLPPEDERYDRHKIMEIDFGEEN